MTQYNTSELDASDTLNYLKVSMLHNKGYHPVFQISKQDRARGWRQVGVGRRPRAPAKSLAGKAARQLGFTDFGLPRVRRTKPLTLIHPRSRSAAPSPVRAGVRLQWMPRVPEDDARFTHHGEMAFYHD